MKSTLLTHYDRYPKMQIQDMVKLIYQNEFAGGHLIKNGDDSLGQIKQEYYSLKPNATSYPFTFEEIGNGLCRIHLSKCKDEGIGIQTVNKLFSSTANTVRGTIPGYEEKLKILMQCCNQDLLPYDTNELDEYISKQKLSGYPLVSHSETYHTEYLPAYRIVKTLHRDYIKVFCEIDALLNHENNVCVAIDGRSSAGKSTLASVIRDVYDCNIFHMDDFFLSPEQKTENRLNEVGGNVGYERFYNEVMVPLKDNRDFTYRSFDCKTGSLSTPIHISPKKLNIIEGVYSMHPTLIDQYDLKIFLDINEVAQSNRIMKRNGAYMHERYQKEWIPLENKYFMVMDIISKSHLYYDTTKLNSTFTR